jgi:lipid-binding SYLF domain-containing protein
MKFLKNLFALMLVCMIAFSCKSEKKQDEATEAIEEVAESAEEMATEELNEEASESAAEVAEEAAAEAAEETAAEDAPKTITVIYPKDTKLANEVKEAMATLTNKNPELKKYFDKAYGFAVFPKITKGGLGIGGAGGHGLVFDNKTVVGGSKLSQATFGLQAGGQQYMEAIFFEDQPAFERFTAGKIKFSGQASAVALKDGASVDINYQDGVAIFTKTIGGLMAEASVGGQGFKYTPGIN